MIKYIIKEKNGNGIIADENNNHRYFEDGDSAADWAEKNDVDPDVFVITKKNIISPEEQSKIKTLRNEALKEQEDYKRLDKAVGNDWYHLGSDAFLGEWVPNDNQGFWGKAYDVGSYPLRLALGGYEGLAKTIYSGLESGAKGVQRVAEGKDLNFIEKEATNPINVAAAAAGPLTSKLVGYGVSKIPLSLPKFLAGGKIETLLKAAQEGLAQGGLALPQTFVENRAKEAKGEETLDYGPMMGYGALGGGLGELGSRTLKGLGKKAFSSEVKVRPSVQDKSANSPKVDFLFDLPKEYTGATPRGKYNPRKWINYGREPGFEKNGKFVETTSELIPLGGVEELQKRIENLGEDWLARRNTFAKGTDAVVNLNKIFEDTRDEVIHSTDLGDAEKIKVLKKLKAEYEDALRTYHKVKPGVTVKKANIFEDDDMSLAAKNYPLHFDPTSVASDVKKGELALENIPILPFEDVLSLRGRVGKNAKFEGYNDPRKKNIDVGLYQTLYKNINKVITNPAQTLDINVPGSLKEYTVKNPEYIQAAVRASMDPDYVIGHNLSGKDLEEFLKTQDVLRNTTPWEIELPRTIARTTNKNLVGLPEMIGTGAGIGLGGATGSTLIDEDDTDAEKLGKMVLAGAAGGALGLGTVKSTMRGLGPARVMYEAGKSLSKEASPSITLEQFEKDKKYRKTEAKKAAKQAQMLVKGGSLGVELPKAYYTAKSVKDLK